MRIVSVPLGIILIASLPAKASILEQVCDVDADYALGMEDYPEAIRLHQRLLSIHPGNALAHYHLGFAYGMTGRGNDEIHEYLTALTLGADNWDLYLNLGLAYLGQGKIGKSIEYLKQGVAMDAGHYELHLDLALAYERNGRLSEASHEIATAQRLNPKDPEIRNMQATIFAELGDWRRARDEWNHLTRTAPDYLPARDNLDLLDDICDQGSGPPRAVDALSTLLRGGPVAVFCDQERGR